MVIAVPPRPYDQCLEIASRILCTLLYLSPFLFADWSLALERSKDMTPIQQVVHFTLREYARCLDRAIYYLEPGDTWEYKSLFWTISMAVSHIVRCFAAIIVEIANVWDVLLG